MLAVCWGRCQGPGWVQKGRKNELGDSSSVCRPGPLPTPPSAPRVPASPPGHASSCARVLLSLLRCCPRPSPPRGSCALLCGTFNLLPFPGQWLSKKPGCLGAQDGAPPSGSAGGMGVCTHLLWVAPEVTPILCSLLFCPACFPRPVRLVLTALASLSESPRLTEVKTRQSHIAAGCGGAGTCSQARTPGLEPSPHATPPLDLMGVGAV